ncbi:ABC transporter substrate-binding protein [Alsobacter sp. SYSU M60028]|uniref:ABC transporter substrate-binding protein n=1 Tax=Alsobacter ponti TaxID=2962936 RepID=A0ABT1LB45_9HYPH|nr:ABC transporter substrate-binding protein [Alsobacter ponti]MCP8937985.1 ABC transporter substrate-binding protein [Alsobacter ponti]
MTHDRTRGVDRRKVLQGFAGAATLAVAAGPAFAQGAAKESPELAKLAADGKLPKLADRLPQNPLVLKGVDGVGRHGGTLRRGLRGSADHNGILRMVGHQGLVRWNPQFTEVGPNVAEKWTVNADATEYVFTLRKGMKWSDGQPFTADDVVFAIEDCAKNTELFKSPPSQLVINGKAGTATKVDDTTVKISFASPYGTFLEQLATPLGQHPTLWARHYCSQFHPKFNPKVGELAKASGYNDWAALFRAKCGDIEIPSRWGNPEKPTIDAWIVEEPYTGGATRVTMKRNPYFWQVDPDGQQLPYVDRINFNIYQDSESLMLDVVSGRLDLQDRHIDNIQNKPTLSQGIQKGNYRLYDLINSDSQMVQIYLNITHKDPKMREVLSNREFRQALSLGIDRKEIIEIVFLGQSEPWQFGPRPEHPWYHEKAARQFTEHDPKAANALLDKIGYGKKDGQGFRQRPDGQKIFITVDVIPANPYQIDTLELVKRHWQQIGIDMKVNVIERALYYTRGDNNDHDAAVWGGPGGLDPMLDPRDFFAQHPQGTRYAIPWTLWYVSGGKDGQEPPEHQKQRMKLFAEASGTTDLKKRGELMKQVFDIAAEQFESIGVCLAVNANGVARNNLRNVPQKMPNSWSFGSPGTAGTQLMYFTA